MTQIQTPANVLQLIKQLTDLVNFAVIPREFRETVRTGLSININYLEDYDRNVPVYAVYSLGVGEDQVLQSLFMLMIPPIILLVTAKLS